MNKVVCVSGYFDPLHVGHLDYFKKAKELGDHLVVIINNDNQAALKKGRAFMKQEERMEIVGALSIVDEVVLSVDTNRDVCETIKMVNFLNDGGISFFCNGGDQNNKTAPEVVLCIELGIEARDGLGDKIQSSSWLTEKNIRY